MAALWHNKLRGYKQIQSGTVEDTQIAVKRPSTDPRGLYNGIVEAKLSLDYPTQFLFGNSLQINQRRTVVNGTIIDWPAIYLRDTVNGNVYMLTTNNGTLVTQPVQV